MSSHCLRSALAALALLFAACSSQPEEAASATPGPVRTATARQALFTNGDFDSGNTNGWTLQTFANYGVTTPPASVADLKLQSGGTNKTKVISGTRETIVPAGLSSGSSLRLPRYGSGTAVVNELGANNNVNSMKQQATMTSADVDPADGKIHVRFALAPVLENPGHGASDQPYFYVVLKNVTKNLTLFSTFNYSNQAGVPWKTDPSTGVMYTDWQGFDIAPGPASLDIGDVVEMQVIAAGCAAGGHFGHIYVDAFGPVVPGLSIAATAPSQANAGSNITYSYLIKNGGQAAATNTTGTIVLPTGTTFVSLNAPGASCTTPAIGSSGTVTCNVGTVNASASAQFDLVVKINANATGKISHGNYNVKGDTISPLIGPLVETTITSGVTYADLAITKSDGVAAIGWGQPVKYVITASNAGPSAVNGAVITDTLPPQLTNATWTCAGANGGVCVTASGAGNMNTTANLPVGGSVTYTLDATVVSGSGNASMSNTAKVTAPSGITDNATSNNTAVDTDSIGTLYTLSVQKAGTGQGTIVSSPAAINCGAGCTSAQAQYVSGTMVSLTATAGSGDTFTGWTGACTGSTNPCTLTISAATSVSATFTAPSFAITTSVPGGNGTLTCPSSITAGQSGTCTVTPAPGYVLASLVDNGSNVTAQVVNGAYTLTNVTAAHAITATFKLVNGQGCSQSSDCGSGLCVDGVCCNSACGGQCEACDVPGSVGTCSAVTGAPRGGRTACTSDGSACGGTCDGVTRNACTYPSGGTVCRAASCTNGIETLATACNGTGACPAPQQGACDEYVCGATACLTTCTTDSDCSSGNYCNAGSCVPKKANGGTCVAANECGSGNCVDGFCCNSSCDGQCEACNAQGAEGTCSPVAGAPRGDRPACATDGTSCGGACDGVNSNACAYPITACRAASCANGEATLAAMCDGAGHCPAIQTQACGAYVCGPTACLGNCTSDGDCASGNWCSGGVCTPKLPNGSTCGGANQCASGECVDGFCCNVACEGQCEACDVAGSEGTCSAVIGAPHNARAACESDGSACGGACDGSSRTACVYPTTTCRAASCAAGTATLEASCDGAGHCPAVQTQSCGTFVCGADACLGNCTVDADCADGNWCSAGVCIPKLANGTACGGANQCDSGACVDGVCCNVACEGQCEACDVQGSVGTCSPVTGAPHGARPACATDGTSCGGTCDGSQTDACVYPAADTVCRAASCTDGTATLEGRCLGNGSCAGAELQNCGEYVCGETACKGDCDADSDCASGSFCSAGVCKPQRANGQACGGANECGSGQCVDGVCCNMACDGQCEACDVAGTVGTCSPVTGAPRGGRVACAGEGSTCGGVCDGVERQACSYPSAETTCRDATCSDGVETHAASCNGAGACAPVEQASCGDYACGSTSCRTMCVTDAQCAEGSSCLDGKCTERVDPSTLRYTGAGGGGCSATGADGSLALVFALLAAIGMTRRRASSLR